jgi:hypothetical protein
MCCSPVTYRYLPVGCVAPPSLTDTYLEDVLLPRHLQTLILPVGCVAPPSLTDTYLEDVLLPRHLQTLTWKMCCSPVTYRHLPGGCLAPPSLTYTYLEDVLLRSHDLRQLLRLTHLLYWELDHFQLK